MESKSIKGARDTWHHLRNGRPTRLLYYAKLIGSIAVASVLLGGLILFVMEELSR